jgi:hypothetical protein
MDLHAESNKGVYKSSGRAFNKAFRPFITKFAKLVEDSMGSKGVAECVNGNGAWQEFKKTGLKSLRDQENVALGGSGSQKSEDIASEEEGYGASSEDINEEKKVGAEEEAVVEKVYLEDMPMSTIEETLVEPKISIEFAGNSYWKSDIGNSIEAL